MFFVDCVEAKCGVRMRSCLKTNQWELTQKARGVFILRIV